MKKINLKSKNNKLVEVKISNDKYLEGATALMITSKENENEIFLNPVTGEILKTIIGDEDRLIVPAHNQEDYLLAKKYNLNIKQIIAPYYKGCGDETIREDIKTEIRNSVIFVVKHPVEDKYIGLDCKNRKCKSFVLGGIDDGETPVEAALRELKEETGYTDCKIDFVSNFRIINHFYAGYKGVNRYAYLNIVFGTLNSEKNIGMIEAEKAKHTVKWIDKKELENFINIDNNIYALNILLYGEKAYEGEGIKLK